MPIKDELAFSKCHLFIGMEQDEITAAVKLIHPTIAAFPAGSMIYDIKAFLHSLIFVLEGTLHVERKEGGKKVLLTTLKEGDSFGAASMFGDEDEFPTTVRAKTNVRLIAVSEDGLISLFQAHPTIALNHVKYLSEKIRFLNKKIAALTGRDAESKVSNYLLKTYGKQTSQQKLNMVEVSRKLDMGRASLYRIISRLHDAKIIHYQNGIIQILQIKELERLSQ